MDPFETLLVFAVCLGIGQILRKTKFNEEIKNFLYIFIIYFALPALVLAVFLKNQISYSDFIITSIALTILIFTIFVAFFASKFLKFLSLSKNSRGSFIITSSHANTGFLGYPLAFYFFNSSGLFYAVLYDLGMFIGLITIITFIASFYGINEKNNREIFINFFKFPPLYAFIIGILIGNSNFGFYTPTEVINFLELIGSTSLYLTLLYLGMHFDTKIFKKIKISIISSIIKLGISPIFAILIIYAISNIISLNSMEKNIIILQSLMPTGLMTLILAAHYKLNLEIASANIITTTFLSIILIFILFVF